MKRVLFVLFCLCVPLCLLCLACRERRQPARYPQTTQPAQRGQAMPTIRPRRAVNLADRFKRVVTIGPVAPPSQVIYETRITRPDPSGPRRYETTSRPATPSELQDSIDSGLVTPVNALYYERLSVGVWKPPWRIEPVKDKFRVLLQAILPPTKIGITWESQDPGYIGKLYDYVGSVSATVDRKHIAYIAKSGGREILVLNHREFPTAGSIGYDTIQLSKAGRLLYAVRTDSHSRIKWFADGKPLADAAFFDDYAFSPDGKRLAHIITTAKGLARLYMDNKLVAESERTRFSRPTFSPDGKGLLYLREHAGKCSAVIAGRPGPEFDDIKRSFPGGGRAFFFSPDSKRVAYVGRRNGKDVLVVDDKPVEPPARAKIIHVAFSSDSKQFAAIAAGDGGKRFVICNGMSIPVRGRLAGGMSFSPDGRRLVYVTIVSGGMMLIVNDTPGRVYEAIIKDDGPLIRFRGPDKLDYLIKKGNKILLAKERLVPIE